MGVGAGSRGETSVVPVLSQSLSSLEPSPAPLAEGCTPSWFRGWRAWIKALLKRLVRAGPPRAEDVGRRVRNEETESPQASCGEWASGWLEPAFGLGASPAKRPRKGHMGS